MYASISILSNYLFKFNIYREFFKIWSVDGKKKKLEKSNFSIIVTILYNNILGLSQFPSCIQMFNKIYSAQKNNDFK